MSQLSLLDIGPLTSEVDILGQRITVYPLTIDGIFYLMSKFIAIKDIMTQYREDKDLIADDFVAIGVDAIGVICAAATIDREEHATFAQWKKEVDKDARRAMRLPPSVQLTVIDATLKLTFRDGARPFAEQLMAMVQRLGVQELVQKFQQPTLESLTPKVNAKEVSGTTLPARSSAALDTGTTRMTSGALHQDS